MKVDESSGSGYMECEQPVPELWYLLILPVSSLGWTAVFRPAYKGMLHDVVSLSSNLLSNAIVCITHTPTI